LNKSLQDKIETYFADKPEVAAVYLFGSHAKNSARRLSDVDIGILLTVEGSLEANRKRMQYMVELGKMLRKDIHPVIMNVASEELLRQIFSTGTCVQINNERELSRFRSIAFSKIAEFGYYRSQFQRGLIRSLGETSQGD